MCTILFAFRAFDDAPLAVAANRDESPDRPSSAPAVSGDDPAVIAPRDERAGGTWMGINEHRLFAVVANRWTDDDLAGDRSRGLLVDDVLTASDVDEATAIVRSETATHEYDGFTLVVATPSAARLFVWDGVLREETLEEGVHVVVNVGADGEYEIPAERADAARTQAANADRIRAAVDTRHGESAADWVRRAGDVLGDHEYGACLHHERYGTVSSSLVTVGADGSIEWAYADGPPCSTPFRPVDGQI